VISKHYKDIKRGIRKNNPIDPYFISRYSFSPYMACEHACKYCDGRAEKYYVEGDYEKDIVIRKNLPDILITELPKLREKGIISIGSGISDPYQQVEKEEKILKRCAEILKDHKFPVSIHTKSSLIQRDIDLWKAINAKNGVLVMISLTTLDDKICKIFEPGASSVEERLKTLRMFKEVGISVGVLAMPFLPFISDSENNISLLISELKNLGVDFILPGSLTLRPGIQKQTYLDVIEQNYPQFLEKYKEIYSNELLSGNPVVSYRRKIRAKFTQLLLEAEIPQLIPHRIYRDRLTLPDEIYVLLNHMIFLYKLRNVSTGRLETSFKSYSNWLLAKRSFFLRRRNLPNNYLTEFLLKSVKSGELKSIISNEKLYIFIKKIIEERRLFNYNNLVFD